MLIQLSYYWNSEISRYWFSCVTGTVRLVGAGAVVMLLEQ